MNFINDSSVKKIISTTMNEFKNRLENIGVFNSELDFTLNDIKQVEELILEQKELCNKNIKTLLQKQLDLSYIGIMTISLLSFAITESNPISHQWLRESGRPDPNLILRNLLIQITNNLLSIIRLVTDGLEHSARIIFRSNCELIWLTSIVLYDKEKMFLYSSSTNSKKQKYAWNELLKPSKLKELISDIEKKVGFDHQLATRMIEVRKSIYKFNSEVSHNSYVQSMVSSYSPNFNEDGNVYSTLYGNTSRGCLDLINNLNDLLFYFIIFVFFTIIEKHHYKIKESNSIWIQTLELKESYVNVYLNLKVLSDYLNHDVELESRIDKEAAITKNNQKLC